MRVSRHFLGELCTASLLLLDILSPANLPQTTNVWPTRVVKCWHLPDSGETLDKITFPFCDLTGSLYFFASSSVCSCNHSLQQQHSSLRAQFKSVISFRIFHSNASRCQFVSASPSWCTGQERMAGAIFPASLGFPRSSETADFSAASMFLSCLRVSMHDALLWVINF